MHKDGEANAITQLKELPDTVLPGVSPLLRRMCRCRSWESQ